MAKDIVPIELGLPEGDVTTLWAPSWREDNDDWEAFLGLGDDLYAFDSTAELLALVRSGAEHDLQDHPSWEQFAQSDVLDFRAADENCYDLVGVLELLGENPTESSVDEIDQSFAIARSIGEVCELDTVTKFFNGNPVLASVTHGMDEFYGRDGLKLWKSIRKTVAKGWDDVLDAIQDVMATPDLDRGEVERARRDLATAEAALPEPEPEPEPAPTGYPEGSLWESVGIDPVKIVFSDQEYLSLRCYLGDRPVFLGDGDQAYVFTSPRGLARFLADNDDATLSRVATYERVKLAAVDGSLDVHVTDDNAYVLAGLDRDIEVGPDMVDSDQLGLAVELITDLANYVGDAELEASVTGRGSALRRFLHYVLNPDDARLLEPTAPFDDEATEWRDLVDDVEKLVTTPDMA
ncbi:MULTISPECIES: primosomal protein [Dietzia]|uniref:Primosomal protein n=1 Tax=Dietzia cinnamea TaxID=321318 RepID=A0AAW5Q878_9ACTN|nr:MULTISPECIES: primosomal protein [Dietzia]MCT1640413.1 primosomal protein [Dietzia cinnamea]MCT1864435.1 primosomal protein [Dietzia cinnamea]MCT1886115.1 primosomal protein [Dietzia cinnamea]MCT2031321.1 primosomal protein [Dietzia cinnamea]MCT2033825.1 primosomal protein [Dietzia cinnamea]